MSEITPESTPDETPASEAAEPAWAPDPAEWQQTQQQLQHLAEIVTPQPQPWQQQQQQQGPPIPDPFAEDYAQQFQAYVEHVNAPLRQWQEQQQLSAAEQQAMSTLDTLAESGGAFDRDTAWARANQIILQNGGDPNKALEQAAKETRDYEARVRAQAVEDFKQQLQGNAGARGQMPARANGAAQTVQVGGYGTGPNAVSNRMFGPG